MRILALYDIHGNPDAVDAVLGDPRAHHPDMILVGGDAVPGPFAAAVLDRLQTLGAPVRWVRGNGEREVAAAVHPPAVKPRGAAAVAAGFTAAEIGADASRALGELPLTVELDGILFCHASPRRDDEMLTRLSPERRFTEALAGTSASIVVAGHTHQQDDRQVGTVRFLNAGSVGLPYEGDGAARWLWLADGVPELRSTEYDSPAAGRRMLEAGWPDSESVEAALVDPIDPIVVTRLFEEGAGGS